MTELYGLNEFIFRQLPGSRLEHNHGVSGTDHNQVKQAFIKLSHTRV